MRGSENDYFEVLIGFNEDLTGKRPYVDASRNGLTRREGNIQLHM
jgi:hypothetical protein